MAEGIVSAFVNKLVSLIEEESALLGGVRENFMLLRDQLEWMKSFLKDAENKRGSSHLVEVWVTQIIDLAYHAEDVIDAYLLYEETDLARNCVMKIMCSGGLKLKSLHQFGMEIEQINTRAERISASRSDYNLELQTQDARSRIVEEMEWRRKGLPTLEESDIVGFKKETDQLVCWLEDDVNLHRKVISIIGMGGLGKTTLARVAYNHMSRRHYFGARAWITVSQDYQVKDLLLSAAKQLDINVSSYKNKEEEEEDLEQRIRKVLLSKRYFVVIDDVWKVEAWERIALAFPDNAYGSRIILTSRNNEVALHADPLGQNLLKLRFFEKEESWELFCRKVFSVSGGTNCPPELHEVGNAILNKCGGLPLAILVIGGVLIGKERSVNAWSKVLDSVSWHLSQDSNICRGILSLSYIDLPCYLKSCFLYLGLFPEDFEIRIKRLILLWVAEGFIQERGEEKMEDIAEDCLEELVHRSMIQVMSPKYCGGSMKICRVHDLLRDLAIYEAKKDRFMDTCIGNNCNSSLTQNRTRRIALGSSKISENKQCFCSLGTSPKLRSLLLFNQSHGEFHNFAFLGKIKLLRVLDLEGAAYGISIPEEIRKLIFLRYLGLRDNGISSLPSSIGELVNLQTLDTGGSYSPLTRLPKSLWKLKNIRHLYLGIDVYERPIGKKYMRDKYAHSANIKDGCVDDFGINLLTLQTTPNIWMYLSEVLLKIGCLRSLMLGGCMPLGNDGKLKPWFPSSLTELCLQKSGLEHDPFEVLGGLPKLQTLVLDDAYKGKQMVFCSGGFPQLKYLILSLCSLEEWTVEDGAIPHLRHLLVNGCDKLNKLPDQLMNISSLQKIEIIAMPDDFEDRLKENGEDWYIIQHVPYVVFKDESKRIFRKTDLRSISTKLKAKSYYHEGYEPWIFE